MPSLYIEEYADMAIVKNGQSLQAGSQPSLAVQKITIDVTSAQSAALNAKTRFIRVHTDAICSYKFGTNPTAAATDARLAANQTEYFAVPPGQSYKVAVITNT